MLKKFFIFILCLGCILPAISNSPCKPVVLKVNVKHGLKGFLFVTTSEIDFIHIDTFSLDKNIIEIKDCINGPKQYACTVESDGLESLNILLFIEPDIPLELSLFRHNDTLSYAFSGSKTLNEWNLYETISSKIMQKNNYEDSLQVFQKKFIEEYRDSYVSGVLIALNASSWGADTISHYLNMLTPLARTYTYASHAEKTMLRKRENSVGAPMRLFAATDNHGQPFSSTMLDGKPILLEFWASWCEPCRKSFPELQKIVKQYQPMGLEVVGISEDMQPEAWLKAIEKDSLQNWHHILSGLKEDVEAKGGEKRISYRFGVTCFPTRILVDKNGIIIGRWEGESEINTTDFNGRLQKAFAIK